MIKNLIYRFCFYLSFFILIQIKSQAQTDSCAFSCSIDINRDDMFVSTVKKADLQEIVVPSVFAIELAHARAYLNYTIPFDTLSNAMGLSLIFGRLLPPCTDCHTGGLCAQDVKFHKLLGTSCASFIWDSKSTHNIIKDTIIGNYKFEIILPGVVRGKAQISPNFLKIEFYSEIRFTVWDRSTVVNHQPKVLVDYQVKGGESTAWHAVLFPSCSKRPFKIPNLPIYLQPK